MKARQQLGLASSYPGNTGIQLGCDRFHQLDFHPPKVACRINDPGWIPDESNPERPMLYPLQRMVRVSR